jgi:hypothetical protein
VGGTARENRREVVDFAQFKELYDENNDANIAYEYFDQANDVWKVRVNPTPDTGDEVTASWYYIPPTRTTTSDSVITSDPYIIAYLALADIYHGEELQIAQKDQSITPNIPLDPVGADKAPRRIMWENKLKMVQNTVSLAGLIFTLVVFVIIPSLITGLYILIHVILYVLFLGFLAPKKPKQWGTVFDMYTKKPVEKAIVRLFSTSYNRLIATQVTSATGTYAFLVGPSSYYVTVEHPMYTNTQTRQIDKTHEKQGFINDDIAVSNKASSEHKNVI